MFDGVEKIAAAQLNFCMQVLYKLEIQYSNSEEHEMYLALFHK